MPICLDPNETFDIALDRDKSKPEATRPTFIVKGCSARKQRELYKLLDEYEKLQEAGDIDGMFDQTIKQLEDSIIGWRNMGGHEFGRDELEDLLTFQEMRELVGEIRHNQHVKEGEKKSSES